MNKICDLDFTFDSKLSFNTHVKKITNIAISTLGFIKRIYKNVRDNQ